MSRTRLVVAAGVASLLLAFLVLGAFKLRFAVSEIVGWLALILGFLVILLISYRERGIRRALVSGFLVRACLALADYYVRPLPYSEVTNPKSYEHIGWLWAHSGLTGVLAHFTTGSRLYSWFISVLYSLIPRSPLAIQGINVLLGSLVIWNVYQIAKISLGQDRAEGSAWIAAFFPGLVLFSAIATRETVIVYTLTSGALCLLKLMRGSRVIDGVLCLLFLVLGGLFHTGITLGVVAAAGVFGLISICMWVARYRDAARRWAAVTLTLLFISGFSFSTGLGLEKVGDGQHLNVARIQKKQAGSAKGRAGYLEGLVASTPLDLAMQTPLRAAYFLGAPFPWMIRSIRDLFGTLDGCLYLVILGLALLSLGRECRSAPERYAVLLLFLSMTAVFALGTSNYGTALRHRAKLAPLAISIVPFSGFLPWRFGRRLTPIGE